MSISSPRIGVGAVILNPERQVLLVLRKKHPEAGTWSIPGGKLELYESLEQAVLREVNEEVGLDLKRVAMLCTAETIRPDNGEHWISIIYKAEGVQGTARNLEPEAIGGIGWFPLNDLPEPIACFTKPALERCAQLSSGPY
ncbi:Diadenosine hexaphosphate hydrolase [Paenibacillus konkukensis]|uniref:Diadenosine hexaphosphate hydrolase n=1 Tax=Paenibacillus konkukensis TaxID=2020716 RepID=A0ABY4RPS8_9BACL|nr:NUDIX domain-containing protein [Paenibacillus konkukensis]UQZ84459.1 Diadenosine hexaphosphate hydrolase [Paenibacillus konkukensis]